MKHESYEYVGERKLRCGYTTGTCAAAASIAAAELLLNDKTITEARVILPGGDEAEIEVEDTYLLGNGVISRVVKNSGDDIDITDGLSICAYLTKTDTPGIKILGGEGVGKVTKPGLSVKVGEAAINPVPQEMIERSLEKVTSDYDLDAKGLEVVISIPGGAEVAQRTFNPKLGITGGLSILGTSGIVYPMSVEAIIKTQKLELSQKRAENGDEIIVFVFGNYGYDFARGLKINESQILKVSNYIGEMIDHALYLGYKRILLIGDLGKLVKLAGGIFRTHSKESDARVEILAANLALRGAPTELIKKVMNASTTGEALEYILEYGEKAVFYDLVRKIKERAEIRSGERIEFEVILFSRTHSEDVLAETPGAGGFRAELRERKRC